MERTEVFIKLISVADREGFKADQLILSILISQRIKKVSVR
jgi:hypothetical protein